MCVSLANTNTISQPLPPTASDQSQTIEKDQPIDDHLYEFSYTLDFARELGFRNIVELLEEENYPAALQALDEKTRAGFPWSTEATNGYQYGFFAEALKAICLEKMDEVVKAYRSYQNARYYCDEEKTGLLEKPLPTLKLELYVGIGKVCNQAGRYTDSLTYLDAARIEAAEYSSISASADRGLIERAECLGELEELLFLFDDLRKLDEMQQAEYITYAETLFRKGKDREGLEVILDGLRIVGIDNKMGLKDPLVEMFLNNFFRTDKTSIESFYTILGRELETARMQKGDEQYIVFLMHARSMLCEKYSYLEKNDDLQVVKERINKLSVKSIRKQNPKNKILIERLKKRRKKVISSQYKKGIKLSNDYSIEDIIMEADFEYKMGKYQNALLKYQNALSNITEETENKGYDDTSIRQAAEIGSYGCKINLNGKILDIPIELQGYLLRDNIVGIQLYTRATNQVLTQKYEEYYVTPSAIKLSHPVYFNNNLAGNQVQKWYQKKYDKVLINFSKKSLETDKKYYDYSILGNQYLCLALERQGKFVEAGEHVWKISQNIINLFLTGAFIGWAEPQKIIETYENTSKKFFSECLNPHQPTSHFETYYSAEKNVKDATNFFTNITNENYEKALEIYKEPVNGITYKGNLDWIESYLLVKMKNYKEANQKLKDVVSKRTSSRQITNPKLAPKEIEIINMYKNHLKPAELEWISDYQY